MAEFLKFMVLVDRAKRPCEQWSALVDILDCFIFIGEWTVDSSMSARAGTALGRRIWHADIGFDSISETEVSLVKKAAMYSSKLLFMLRMLICVYVNVCCFLM